MTYICRDISVLTEITDGSVSKDAPEPRFRALVPPDDWARLPLCVQARFDRHLGGCASVTYAGEIAESRRTWLGAALANAARLIGSPLPLRNEAGVPAVVTVTEDGGTSGQIWTRMYCRHRGFPQVIHSSKRFAGPTGLEEYLGRGFGIALTVQADPNGLHFRSDHYFVVIGAHRVRLPAWLAPGNLTISHLDQGGGWFAFALILRHRLFGELIRQVGLFRERGG
jgi:hypothetical protein